jgi:hypothetical protein
MLQQECDAVLRSLYPGQAVTTFGNSVRGRPIVSFWNCSGVLLVMNAFPPLMCRGCRDYPRVLRLCRPSSNCQSQNPIRATRSVLGAAVPAGRRKWDGTERQLLVEPGICSAATTRAQGRISAIAQLVQHKCLIHSISLKYYIKTRHITSFMLRYIEPVRTPFSRVIVTLTPHRQSEPMSPSNPSTPGK